MTHDAIISLFAIALGFAVAGVLSNGYQAVVRRPPTFSLLQIGPVPAAFAAVPFLMFAAPFMIMRMVVRRRGEAMHHFQTVMTATVACGVWSMMSGTWVLMGMEALGWLRVYA
jgi:hypothetical protein